MSIDWKIDRSEVEDIMQLTSMQEGILIEYLLSNNPELYFEQINITISSPLNIRIFRNAWNKVLRKHEMLRTVFRWETLNTPIQIVLKNHEVTIYEHDFSSKNVKQTKQSLDEVKEQDIRQGFDLRYVPFRVHLCKLDQNNYEMIISNHHILYDGWSNGIILRDFLQAYESLLSTSALNWKNTNINQYKNFIKWLKSKETSSSEEFWRRYLDETQASKLTQSNKINVEPNQTFNFHYTLSEEFQSQIQDFITTNDLSIAPLIYGAWAFLLMKYTNSLDVVFGTTVSGRTSEIAGISEMVGLFINTIPLHVKSTMSQTVAEFIKAMNDNVIERESYHNASLSDISNYANVQSIRDLFNSIVIVQNYPISDSLFNNENLKIQSYSMFERNNFDLTFEIMTSDKYEINIKYNNEIFDHNWIRQMTRHLVNIIQEFVSNKDMLLKDVAMVDEDEMHKLLTYFNDTKTSYPSDKNIHQLFEVQAAKKPNAPAVRLGDEIITYRELNEKANRLARLLRKRGVREEHTVGVMVERSIEMIIAILGVLKAEGAYLPIDPAYPKERIEYMLADSGARILLAQADLAQHVDDFDLEIIGLDSSLWQDSEDDTDLRLPNKPNNLAYIIYTSGSTGKPKGVMIEHASLVNYIWWAIKQYVNNQKTAFPLYTSFSFDLTVTSIFTPLITGNEIVVYADTNNGGLIYDVVQDNQVEIIKATPTHLRILSYMSELPAELSVKKFIVGGEDLQTSLANKITQKFNGAVEIYNEYGPTEATVGCMIYRYDAAVDHSTSVPIGIPIDNTKIYILDKFMNPVPIGVEGELFVGGVGLARGYLNQPALTTEKFVVNPFHDQERIYRTGDLGRWGADGNIEYLGRMDEQVKIRGYRVEVSEVDHALREISGVGDSIVVTNKDNYGEIFLAAYYVSECLSPMQIRELLAVKLSNYMMPSHFVRMESIPLTINGKIDKNRLPNPKQALQDEFYGPTDQIELIVSDIWSQVLESDPISIHSNFFQSGGHSLKVMKLMSLIQKTFHVNLSIQDFFENPTIKATADLIREKEKVRYRKIELAEKKPFYPLTSAQKRFFFLDRLDGIDTTYNISALVEIDGHLEIEKLNDSFRKLIERHPSLRTSFILKDGEPVQVISDSCSFEIEHISMPSNINIEHAMNQFIRQFNLSEPPLLRVGLVEVTDRKHFLLFDSHHIISDAISSKIMVRDLIKLYEGKTLPPLSLQYIDFSTWQSSFLKSETIDIQKKYWEQLFSDGVPKLNLPTDFVRPEKQTYEGNTLRFNFDSSLSSKIITLSIDTGSTVYMVVLTIYYILLSKYTNSEDIVVGSPVSDRNHPELENVVGVFINMLALRNYPNGNKTFMELLQEVKTSLFRGIENKEYPYEELVSEVNITRDMGINPLFSTILSFQEKEIEPFSVEGLVFTPYSYDSNKSYVDLTIMIYVSNNIIEFIVNYSTGLFHRETIEEIYRYLETTARQVLQSPSIKIMDIELISNEKLSAILAKLEGEKVAINRRELDAEFNF